MEAGLEYDETKGWQTIKEHTKQISHEPVRLSAKADFKAYLRPKFLLMVYGVVGPYGSGQFYLQLEADPFATPWWELYFGVDFEVGIRFEVLSRKIADHNADIISYRILLAQADSGYEATDTPESGAKSSPTYNTATVLVFDTSGSMREIDTSGMIKLEAAQSAGRNILNIIEAENQAESTIVNQIGIVDFNFNARIDMYLSDDILAAESALYGLYADGGTGMPDGLKAAVDLFLGVSDSQGKYIFLLSDGMPNIGYGNNQSLTPEEVEQQVFDQADRARQEGVCIYSIGFGIPGAVGEISGEASINEEFLKQVSANAGCGSYYNAQTSTQLANIYVELRHKSTGNILLQQQGEISQNQQVEIGVVQVPDNQAQLISTINWPGSKLELQLIDPNNQIVDEHYPDADFSSYETLASVIIKNPIPGQWRISAFGIDVPGNATTYNAILSSRPNLSPPPVPKAEVELPQSPGFGVALVFILLMGSGMAIYIFSQRSGSLRRKQEGTQAASLLSKSGQTFPVADGYVIGRHSSCQIRLAGKTVSRRHARLRFAQGKWFIQDLDSKTGMLVNGRRINATALHSGDQIYIGSYEFTFRVDS